MENIYIIIQARMGSSRRPGKINYLFNNEPMLVYQINRLKAFGIKNIIVATSTEEKDDLTEKLAKSCDVKCFRGSENDVLKRFYECCKKFQVTTIIRVGGDDPLIDPEGIKLLVQKHKDYPDFDLLYSSHPNGWIYGTAAELFTFASLEKVNDLAKSSLEREHVIPYYKKDNNFKILQIESPMDIKRKDIYLSVDYQEDLDLVEQIIDFFTQKKKRYTFTQIELIKLYDSGKLVINNKHLHDGF